MAEEAKDSRLRELAMKYKALKEEREGLEESAKMKKQEEIAANRALVDHMDSIGVTNFDMDEKKFFVKTYSNAKAKKGESDEETAGITQRIVDWLQADEEGKNLLKLTYHWKTFSGFLFERFSNGGPMPPSDLIDDPAAWVQRVVQMNALKKKV